MTEIFKCKKPGTKCCAPKSLIKEKLGGSNISHIEETTIPSVGISYTTPTTVMLTVTSSKVILYFMQSSTCVKPIIIFSF